MITSEKKSAVAFTPLVDRARLEFDDQLVIVKDDHDRRKWQFVVEKFFERIRDFQAGENGDGICLTIFYFHSKKKNKEIRITQQFKQEIAKKKERKKEISLGFLRFQFYPPCSTRPR